MRELRVTRRTGPLLAGRGGRNMILQYTAVIGARACQVRLVKLFRRLDLLCPMLYYITQMRLVRCAMYSWKLTKRAVGFKLLFRHCHERTRLKMSDKQPTCAVCRAEQDAFATQTLDLVLIAGNGCMDKAKPLVPAPCGQSFVYQLRRYPKLSVDSIIMPYSPKRKTGDTAHLTLPSWQKIANSSLILITT